MGLHVSRTHHYSFVEELTQPIVFSNIGLYRPESLQLDISIIPHSLLEKTTYISQ